MNIADLAAGCVELPPAFRAWCDCGWKGKIACGATFTVGMNAPIEESPNLTPKCPQCGKGPGRLHRLTDAASLTARLRWVLDKPGTVERDAVVFPCHCNPTPACRVVGDAEVKDAVSGEPFDHSSWARVMVEVKCNGCHAAGKVALMERHAGQDVCDQPWSRYYRPPT